MAGSTRQLYHCDVVLGEGGSKMFGAAVAVEEERVCMGRVAEPATGK